MNKRMLWSRILCVIGLVVLAIAVVLFFAVHVPGWWDNAAVLFLFLTLPASSLVALGALLGRSRYRTFLYVSLGLTVLGLITYVLAFADSWAGHAPWWAFVEYGYVVGAFMSCVGAVLVLIESFHGAPVSKNDIERNTNSLSS